MLVRSESLTPVPREVKFDFDHFIDQLCDPTSNKAEILQRASSVNLYTVLVYLGRPIDRYKLDDPATRQEMIEFILPRLDSYLAKFKNSELKV